MQLPKPVEIRSKKSPEKSLEDWENWESDSGFREAEADGEERKRSGISMLRENRESA